MAKWLFGLVVAATGVAGADAPDIAGFWLLETGDVALEIVERDGHYEGVIVWLKEPEYPAESRYAGEAKRDLYNPDPEKRSRPLLGMTVLWGFEYRGENNWESGSVYDADSGRLYSAALRLDGQDTLTARAYVGIQFLGKSITARRWGNEEAEKALGGKLNR